MDSQLFIPSKIKVGYNERNDTYTKRLAYVIYFDKKGVLRKETSWEGWRDKTIEANEYPNTPTEGFVLNKKAGGYSSGWNHRATYCRVYDPRGFEFEISIPNLLFILQECDAFKGKGLDGKFVYAWEGKDLVLLPASCQEFKDSFEYTELQGKKVGAKDVVLGCSYKTKKQENWLYLGRFDYYTYGYSRVRGNCGYESFSEKMHIFINETASTEKVEMDEDENGNEIQTIVPAKTTYVVVKGFNDLAVRLTETPVTNYAELVDDFRKSRFGTKIVGIESKPMKVDFSKRESWRNTLKGTYYKLQKDGSFISYTIRQECDWNGGKSNYIDMYEINSHYIIEFKDDKLKSEGAPYKYDREKVKKEIIEKMDFCQLYVILESGSKIKYEELNSIY